MKFVGEALSAAVAAAGILFATGIPAGAEPLPFQYKVSEPACVVAVSGRFRSPNHRNDAFMRVFVSFGELALEHEKAGDLPEAGLSWEIADLMFLHFGSRCEDRLEWARMFVDDYHGRFPDDGDLTVRPDVALPPDYLATSPFTRVKPVDRIADCRLTFGYRPGTLDGRPVHDISFALFEANKDLRRLKGTLTPHVGFDGPREKNRLTAAFIDSCDRRLEIVKEIAGRLQKVYPGIATFEFPSAARPEPPPGKPQNPYYRDTRAKYFEYLPPRRDGR